MSERIVTLRHDQTCDVCKHPIKAGEKAYMTRDDFWPSPILYLTGRRMNSSVTST